jgi:hypothetical protein
MAQVAGSLRGVADRDCGARRRARSRGGARPRFAAAFAASLDACRRSSAAPISIPTRTASGWKRSSQRIEELANRSAGPAAAQRRRAVADHRLAAMLKEALAANTIGGKVDDDSRFRAGERRRASGAGQLVANRPGARRRARALADRFQRASAIRRRASRAVRGRGPRSEPAKPAP